MAESPIVAQILIAAGAAVIGLLGLAHLILTFRSDALRPRDETVDRLMRETPLVITRQTTVWKAWLGFNASHSMSAILFAAIYGYLALRAFDFLVGSWFLIGLSFVFLAIYIVLAKRYWFSKPFQGILLATALMLSGYALALL